MKKLLIVFLALGLIGAAFGLAACETFEAEVTVARRFPSAGKRMKKWTGRL